jgi:hypothetical protein
LNVPSGSHIITVKYVSVSTFSNLLEENFGVGANTTTLVAAAYCYHNLDVVPSTCPNSFDLEDEL